MQIKRQIIVTVVALLCMQMPAWAADQGTVIGYGMRGSEVLKLQQLLVHVGYLTGKTDGIFGPKTLQAVKSFQEAVEMKPTGVVDQAMLAVLGKYQPRRKFAQSKEARLRDNAKRSMLLPTLPTLGSDRRDQLLRVVATAYTRYDEGCTDYTYRGNYLQRGLAAVDPEVIPLGTKLYVPGYGYAVADDIGGAIKGHRIDLAMDTREEAFQYGMREITVYVLR